MREVCKECESSFASLYNPFFIYTTSLFSNGKKRSVRVTQMRGENECRAHGVLVQLETRWVPY